MYWTKVLSLIFTVTIYSYSFTTNTSLSDVLLPWRESLRATMIQAKKPVHNDWHTAPFFSGLMALHSINQDKEVSAKSPDGVNITNGLIKGQQQLVMVIDKRLSKPIQKYISVPKPENELR